MPLPLVEHVVLAGDVEHRHAGALEDLVGVVELARSLESWLTSPVWMMKSGLSGIAAILATAIGP